MASWCPSRVQYQWHLYGWTSSVSQSALFEKVFWAGAGFGWMETRFVILAAWDDFHSVDQFKKIIECYKRVGYNMDIMRHYSCLVVNPITVYSYGFLLNCPFLCFIIVC